MSLKGKTLLVTGGTGSLGRKLIETVLKTEEPAAVRVFSRDELKQFNMRRELNDHPKLRFLLGDVRDLSRLTRAMEGADVVVNAAALKQIDAAEYNPLEAIKTNIVGAANVIDAAIDAGVEKAVQVSTDKAVYPVNLYGATKLAAEKLFVHGNVYSGSRKTRFSCVRYGNVVGSRGSVLPLFLELKGCGEFPITDEKMTRFWITLDQAVKLVLLCVAQMKGGEIFVPKIPSMRITELASAVDSRARLKIVGIRPGEKLHESLLTSEEAPFTEDCGSYFVVRPQKEPQRNGVRNGNVPADFEYRSDKNDRWLLSDELQQFIQDPR